MLDHMLLAASSGIGLAQRGNKYFVAPGTSTFLIRNRTITPLDTNTGLTPLVPFATVNHAFSVLAAGDTIVLMKEGNYNLTANISSTLANIKMVAWPGLHPQQVTIAGVAGGAPMILAGRQNYLAGFSIETADAAYSDLVLQGSYCRVERMHFDSDGTNTPLVGLSLKPKATGESASAVEIIGCRFADCATGLRFEFTVGDFAGPTNVLIAGCRFRHNTTRDIAQEVGAWINGVTIRGNDFEGPIGTDFIKLDEANNGNSEINAILDNVFAHNAITATEVDLTDTVTAFKFVGNRDKTGFITGV